MRFVVGCDHGGFPLKTAVIEALRSAGNEVRDLGAFNIDPDDDYPDMVRAVTEAITTGRAARGVLICGSGVGASVAANKVPGIRAAVCHDTFSAHQGVEDDDMNVLALGARVIGPQLAIELVRTFQSARFSGAERHVRRLAKVRAIEQEYRPREDADA